ncbi:MAG: serine hydrolase [Oculatellaceae cyanobacterium bins.114]|nr:serine hydrolase [Oculatellaceae cyanobacterium bins.114]
MLESNKPSKFMRRRLVRQKSTARPVPPTPMRSPEGRHLLPPPGNGLDMRQPGYPAQPPLPLNPAQKRISRQNRHNPSVPEDNNRFNLRHLLNDRPDPNGRSSRRGNGSASQQRRKDGKTSTRSRTDAPPGSQISYPISPNRSGTGLQPYSGAAPGVLRKPSRSKLANINRSGNIASTGSVRVLNPHPVVPLAPGGLRRPQRRSRRNPSVLLYVTRLLILGIGVGAIAGTILSVWNPASRERPDSQPVAGSPLNSAENISNPGMSRDLTPGAISPLPVALKLNQPIAPLATTVQSLTAQYPGLSPGVFLVDLDTGAYLDLNGGSIFSAASTIKVPILVAFLQDVDAGKIRLDEMLTMQQADVTSGSGELQDQPVGSQYTALDVAIKMITISDNTATNMLITRLGGAEALNQRFRTWGLTSTQIRRPLADLEGRNTTSPKDLTGLLALVSQGDLLSLRSRDRMFDIMQGTQANSLLPSALEPGATIAHKTGTIDTMVGDTGIVDMPNGKRFIITVVVQRPVDDERASDLIRQISREVYQYFNNAQNPQVGSPLPTQVSLPSSEATPTRVPSESYSYPPDASLPVPNQSPNSPLPFSSPYPNTGIPTSPVRGSQ